MSDIVKTEAIVLQKIKYGDTSVIVTLFTKDYGKMAAIVKGARNPKSKLGLMMDVLNHLQIVFYRKESREVQFISSADLVSHFPNIKNNFDSLKYAQAILELVKNLIAEHEVNFRMFNGLVRIFSLMEESKEISSVLFSRFFMFFLAEIGYQIQIHKCIKCGKRQLVKSDLAYNFDLGIFCNECSKTVIGSFQINSELFEFMTCLKYNQAIPERLISQSDKAILFMEKHLKHHVPDFKGLQAIRVYNNFISK